jgi:hypothetical protein
LFTYTDEPLSNATTSSRSYTTVSTGTDYWVATYNGDSNNFSVSSSCSGEPVTVNQAPPSASASASGTAGSAIGASAIQASLSGGASQSGTITFKVFGPQSRRHRIVRLERR